MLLGVMSPEWCAAMEGAWAQHFDTGGRAGGEKADPWDEAIMDRLAVENPGGEPADHRGVDAGALAAAALLD